MRWIPRTELALALALLMIGCAERVAAPIPAAHPDDLSPRSGGTVRLASFADIRGLDPATVSDSLAAGIIAHIYSGLVDFDAHGKPIPEIAERWDISPDGLLYTFEMRRGVLFHDGEEVTADDVKRTMDRALHPDTPNSYSSFFESIDGYADYTKGKTQTLEGVKVLGRYTVSIRLTKRDAMFLSVFALPSSRLVCKSAGNRYDDAFEPCGAGPFKVPPNGWEHGRSLKLVRHDRFFKPGEPHLDGIEWSFGMSPLTQRYQLEAGKLDGNRELALIDALRFSRDERWKPFGVYEAENLVAAIGLNVEVPPFDNVEVRRAIGAVINREHVRLLKTPNLRAIGRILPPPVTGDDPDFPAQKYDLDAAREHMRRAGLPNGWPKPITYLVTRQGLDEQMAQIFQQALKPIGLDIEIRLVNFPTFLALTHRRHEVAMSPAAWQEDFPDAADYFEPLFTTASINDEDTNNISFYSNKTLDDILVNARGEMDEKKRASMYREADAIICSDAPWVPVYTYRYFVVHQPYLRGYVPHVVWNEDMRTTWLDRAGQALEKHAGVLRDPLRGHY